MCVDGGGVCGWGEAKKKDYPPKKDSPFDINKLISNIEN